MIKKSTLKFPSKDRIHTIYGTKWVCDSVPLIGVLQIVHGMAEHIERYEEFAEYMAEKGFVVVGDDHLGHGRTGKEYGDYGYFSKKDAAAILVRDVHRLKKMIQKEYPNLPYFILGHSMGSLILRNYLVSYGTGIKGAILCGTAAYSQPLLWVARFISGCFRLAGKDRDKSAFQDKLVFFSYNQKTENRTAFDWLTRDEKEVDLYMNDPMCGFLFTNNGFMGLYQLSERAGKKVAFREPPKDLPIKLIAGKEDPAGNYGEGVTKVYEAYKQAGKTDVQLTLYEGMRHEILNEYKKEQVYEDIYGWLKDHL